MGIKGYLHWMKFYMICWQKYDNKQGSVKQFM